jgi:cell division protein FtsN
MTNLQTAGQPGQGPMSNQSVNEDTKYIKRIDDLIEEAEIEAELEAEKKIRSKNTKLLTISILGCALLLFLYVRMNGEEKIIAEAPAPEVPVTEINIPLADEPGPMDLPIVEKAVEPLEEAAQPAPEKAAETAPEAPAEEKTAPAPVKAAEAPKPARKAEKVTIKTASTRGAEIKPKPAPRVSSHPYFVQTGVFSVKGNAEKLSRKLQAAGFSPSISVKSRKLDRHVVKVGHFADEAAGESMKKELAANGFEAVLSKDAAGNHSFLVGSFKSREEASVLQDRLSRKGFLSAHEMKTVTLPLYAVELGGFASTEQAKETQAKLGQAGFSNHFIR